MLAVRASEQAAASAGIGVTAGKLGAFAGASSIAGPGGALLACSTGQFSSASFDALAAGLPFLAFAYTGGITSVTGGIIAGVLAPAGDVGYHEAAIVRSTELARVAQGTFYLYFESKRQVFEEVVADLNHRVRQAMASASAGTRSRMEAERRGFAAFFRFTAEHPALYRVIRQAEFVSPEAMRGHYERIIAGYIPQLEAGMADGEVAATDPIVLAWALIAVGEMAGMRWILWDSSRAMPPEVFEQVMTVVGRMLGTHGEHQDGTRRSR